MTFTRQDAYRYVGHSLHDGDHHRIGRIRRAFRGPTGSLDWVTVAVGHLHHAEKFVPIADAQRTDEGLVVPFSRATVAAAPMITPVGRALTADQETVLRAHYTAGPADPPAPAPVDPDRRRVRPRSHETTFGTGEPGPGEPDDVTLQGTGNSAPRHSG